MSVLVVIGIGVTAWMVCCLLIVALCASAKRGDGEEATAAADVVDPSGHGVRRRAPALS